MKTLLLALSLLCAQWAGAQCTQLQYVGAPYSTVTAETSGTGTPLPITGPLTGTITLALPLAANLSNAQIALVTWDFSLTFSILNATQWLSTQGGYEHGNPSITVSTDANGNITSWNLSLESAGPSEGSPLQATATSSSSSGDRVNYISSVGGANPALQIVYADLTAMSRAPGAWTCLAAFSAPYTAAPDPPRVDPLTAQVASLAADDADRIAVTRVLTVELNAANARIRALTLELAKK